MPRAQLIERHFGPNDMAAITYTSGRTDGAQEFTSERAALLAAIDKFQGRKLRSTVIEKADQYFQQHLERARGQSIQPRRSRRAERPSTIRDGSRADGLFGHHDRSRRFRARPPRGASAGRPEKARRSDGRHPWTPQSGGDVQRGHRLSDLRHLRVAGGDERHDLPRATPSPQRHGPMSASLPSTRAALSA